MTNKEWKRENNKIDIKSNIKHSLLAGLFQFIFILIFYIFDIISIYTIFLSAVPGIFFYLGNETAQMMRLWLKYPEWGEYKWWKSFLINYWDIDSILDLIFPITTTLTTSTLLVMFIF